MLRGAYMSASFVKTVCHRALPIRLMFPSILPYFGYAGDKQLILLCCKLISSVARLFSFYLSLFKLHLWTSISFEKQNIQRLP